MHAPKYITKDGPVMAMPTWWQRLLGLSRPRYIVLPSSSSDADSDGASSRSSPRVTVS